MKPEKSAETLKASGTNYLGDDCVHDRRAAERGSQARRLAMHSTPLLLGPRESSQSKSLMRFNPAARPYRFWQRLPLGE